MVRRRQYPIALVLLAVFLTACRGSVPDTPALTPSTPSTAITTTSAVAATNQPIVAVTATATVSAAASTAEWASLESRPLHLPTLGPGMACPVTSWQVASKVDPKAGFPSSGGYFAFGKGPIFPLIYNFSPDQGTVRFAKLPAFSGNSKQDKVLWLARPSYPGPALIRGRELGGVGVLGFGPTDSTPSELRFPLDTGVGSADTAYGWRDLPSYMVIPALGCYAFQLDGRSFSDVIVFQVGP
jgi:hypothetical protein